MTATYEGLNLDPNRLDPRVETDPRRRRVLDMAVELQAVDQEPASPRQRVPINEPPKPPVDEDFSGNFPDEWPGAIVEDGVYCKPPLGQVVRTLFIQQP